MRESTLLVSTLFILNVLELLLLLKIGLTTSQVHLPIISDLLDQERQNAEAVIMKKQCAMKRWLLTHAEHSATTITFMFPIRLVAGVVVSCLLMSGGLAS